MEIAVQRIKTAYEYQADRWARRQTEHGKKKNLKVQIFKFSNNKILEMYISI